MDLIFRFPVPSPIYITSSVVLLLFCFLLLPTVTPSTHTLIYDCFMYAHMCNVGKPGSFQEELNKIRKINNLPPLKIPDNPPSEAIRNVLSKQTSSNTTKLPETGRNNEEITNITNTREEKTEDMEEIAGASANTTQKSESARLMSEAITTQSKKHYPTNADDIGLVLYTKQSVGWPMKTEFSRKTLMQGIENKKYKFTYTKNTLTEEDIMKMIKNRTLDIPAHCFA